MLPAYFPTSSTLTSNDSTDRSSRITLLNAAHDLLPNPPTPVIEGSFFCCIHFQYDKIYETLPWVKDYSKEFVAFVGLIDLLAGLGLILPELTGILPWLTPLAALGASVILILAIALHVKRNEIKLAVPNIVFFGTSYICNYWTFQLREIVRLVNMFYKEEAIP
jgi:hypothetical protein